MKMSAVDLEALEALARAATPGPWHNDKDILWGGVTTKPRGYGATVALITSKPDSQVRADAAFIVAACNAAIPMVEEIRELRAEVARLKEDLASLDQTHEQWTTDIHEFLTRLGVPKSGLQPDGPIHDGFVARILDVVAREKKAVTEAAQWKDEAKASVASLEKAAAVVELWQRGADKAQAEAGALRAEMENCAKIADIIEVCTPNARPEARAIARQLRTALAKQPKTDERDPSSYEPDHECGQ